jgi:hypothetical protein
MTSVRRPRSAVDASLSLIVSSESALRTARRSGGGAALSSVSLAPLASSQDVSDGCYESPPSESVSDTSGAGAPRRAQPRRAVSMGGARRAHRRPRRASASARARPTRPPALVVQGERGRRAPSSPAIGRLRALYALLYPSKIFGAGSRTPSASGGPGAPHNAAAPPPPPDASFPTAPSLGSEARSRRTPPPAGSGLQ